MLTGLVVERVDLAKPPFSTSSVAPAHALTCRP